MNLRVLLTIGLGLCGFQTQAAERMNLLLITSDDMSCDSVGVYGCKLQDTTPHMDRLAARSFRFNHAFVQVGNCMPSRNVMYSGRYPHNNRVEGFYQIKDPGYPVLADLMKAAGYYTGIRGKVAHSTPYSPYPAWDVVLDTLPDGTPAHVKNVASYRISAAQGMAAAKKAGKPFYLNLNISDPHKPFYNEGGQPDPNVPSRVFTAAEVPVPGFLPDDPAVREELALYYSSVRRGDDCLGGILRALDESGEAARTVIVFLSDHGMPLPFAKTQLYFHSTRTPWMVRWPGVTQPGAVDDRHLISAVDMLPTLLDIFGRPHPPGLDGRSFAPLLRGETQADRDYVVAEYNENSGGNRHPMRAIITKDYSYLFNPWSNGERVMATATRGTVAFRRMQALATTDPKVAARLDLFEHRVPEELYNYAADPDALDNLIKQPAHRAQRDRLIALLDAWMVRTKDPILSVFRQRDNLSVREAYMVQMQKEADSHKEPRRQGGKKGGKKAKAAARSSAGGDE
jgi:N-sulfoglucosamine sulfohydrolase